MSYWPPDSPGASPAALRGGARCRGRGAVWGGRPGGGVGDHDGVDDDGNDDDDDDDNDNDDNGNDDDDDSPEAFVVPRPATFQADFKLHSSSDLRYGRQNMIWKLEIKYKLFVGVKIQPWMSHLKIVNVQMFIVQVCAYLSTLQFAESNVSPPAILQFP